MRAKILDKLVDIAYVLITVGSLLYLVYLFVAGLLHVLNSLNSDTGKAIITAGATVIVATITIVAGKIWEQRIKQQYDLREKKIPVYEKQIGMFFELMFAAKLGKEPPTAEKLQDMFVGFTEKLIIWGGPGVIKAWSAFRDYAAASADPASSTANPQGMLSTVEQLLLAIRKDLGNSNWGLDNNILLRTFINDVPMKTGGGDK